MSERKYSRAIVTGANGLLGRALVTRLLEDQVRVLAVDLRQPDQKPPAGVTFYRADITDADAITLPSPSLRGVPGGTRAASAEFWQQPETTVLFHLAGIAHAGYCRQEPLCGAAVNVTGALTVVEACRQRGVRRVVFPSTGLVYGPEARVPASETDPPCPTSFYAATKLAAEALLQGYAYDFDVAVDVVRLGNVYGFGAPSDTVHSILLRQAAQGEPLRVKTLRPIRDFIYVKDVAEGMVRLARSPSRISPRPGARGPAPAAVAARHNAAPPLTRPGGESGRFRLFNLSSGRPTSIGKLACVIAQAAGCHEEPRETEPEGPGSLSALVLDIGKLTETLGWRPEWSLEDGIAEVLAQMRRGEL